MTSVLKRWVPVLAVIAVMAAGTALSLAVNNGVVSEVKQVSVTGDITVNQRNAVFRLLTDYEVLAIPIDRLQQELAAEGWIQSATVERRWPDELMISIVPERPIALWNDDAYLNDEGEVFNSPFVNQARLPQLYGPVGKEAVVMAQYQQLNTTLFRLGQSIETLTLGARENWRFQSDAGIEVLLGKAALMERIQRLLRVTEFIDEQGRLDQVEQIDTRYGNGVAVAWKDQSSMAMMKPVVARNYNSQREEKL
jgi:cell division protein FtsQ